MNKLKLILTITLAAVLLITAACSSNPSKYAIEVSYDEFEKVQETISRHVTKSIEVPVGSTFTVILWSNQTTGFKWSESAMIDDQNMIKQTAHKYLAHEEKGDTPPPPGTAGKEEWTFKTIKEGTTTVFMEYSQPWEGGEKDAFGFFLEVTVE